MAAPNSIFVLPPNLYSIARALGGDATPPGTFSGALVKKKEYLPNFAHVSASFSKSQNSPNGVPQNESR